MKKIIGDYDILRIFGKTKEGIVIESRINIDGEIITSFPKYDEKYDETFKKN